MWQAMLYCTPAETGRNIRENKEKIEKKMKRGKGKGKDNEKRD